MSPRESLEFAVEVAGIGVWEYDPANGRMRWSKRMVEMFGCADALEGREVLRFVHPEDLPDLSRRIDAFVAGRGDLEADARIIRPDGSIRYLHGAARWKVDGRGVKVRLIGTVLDLTQAYRSEERMQQRDALHRRLVESSPEAILLLRDRRIAFANPAGLQLLGAERAEQVIGLADSDLAQPDSYTRLSERMECAATTGAVVRFDEERLRRIDGATLEVEAVGVPFKDAEGDAIQLLIRDVTEQRRLARSARAAQRMIERIADSIPHHLWMWDAQDRVTFRNRCHREFFQEGRLTPQEAIHPDDLARLLEGYRRAAQGKPAHPVQARLLRRDGVYRWFEIRSSPVRDEAGETIAWVGTATDIEETRELRLALRREELRYREIAELAPGLLFVAEQAADGRISLPVVSARGEELVGISARVLAEEAQRLLERVHPDDRAGLLASIDRAVDSGTDWQHEVRYLHPDGRELWLEGRASHGPGPDGCRLWHGSIQDVSARRRAEDALRTSRAQLIAALRAGEMGSWSFDLRSGQTQLDQTARRLWNLSPDARMPSLDEGLERVHVEDRASVQQAFDAAYQQGAGQIEEYRVLQGDQPPRWLSTYAVVERDPAGIERSISGVHVDVTERRRSQEAQLQSQKLEALGILAGGIAHDFNNVLTAIEGNAELIQLALPDEHAAVASAKEILRASERGAALVRQILAFSRPELSQRKRIALAPVVAESLRMLRASLPASLELRAEIAADLPAVFADSTQMHQIVVNLVSNAAQAIGARRGRVELELRALEIDAAGTGPHPVLAPGRWLELSVRDDGEGMSRETQARVFDPFFTTRAPGQGSGLGLSTVHRIVTAHGGAIAVESERGTGAIFRIWLPGVEGRSEEAERVPEHVHAPGSQRRVLFVDDEPAIVALARRALGALGYEVIGLSNAAEALARLRSDPSAIDVLITDVAMPRVSGFELARAARAGRPSIPVLMLSGNAGREDRERASELGVCEVLEKPCAMQQIAAAIERAVPPRRRTEVRAARKRRADAPAQPGDAGR